MNAAGVDPAIVEVEEGADGEREVGGFIVPSGLVKRLDFGRPDVDGVAVYLIDEAEKGLVLFVEGRAFEIAEDAPDQRFIP